MTMIARPIFSASAGVAQNTVLTGDFRLCRTAGAHSSSGTMAIGACVSATASKEHK